MDYRLQINYPNPWMGGRWGIREIMDYERIASDAIDLGRMQQGGIPLLDHHKQDGLDSVLGRVTETWIKGGALMGRLKFNLTDNGQKAEGMVARGEIAGIEIDPIADSNN